MIALRSLAWRRAEVLKASSELLAMGQAHSATFVLKTRIALSNPFLCWNLLIAVMPCWTYNAHGTCTAFIGQLADHDSGQMEGPCHMAHILDLNCGYLYG